MAYGLHAQQHQQEQAAEQVKGHNRGEQLHGDGQGTKRTLNQHPKQGERCPGRVAWAVQRGFAVFAPRQHHQRDDEYAHHGGQVAVNHLYPGFAEGDRAGGHGGFGHGDFMRGAEGAGVAVAAGPVGAAQAGVRQAREGAEHDQVKGQKQGEQAQGLQTACAAGAAVASPHPQQGGQGDDGTQGHQLQQRR